MSRYVSLKNSFYSGIVFSVTVILSSMAYAAWNTINPSEYSEGALMTSTLMGKIIGNVEDLNTRVSTIESTPTPLSGVVTGPFSSVKASGSKTVSMGAHKACFLTAHHESSSNSACVVSQSAGIWSITATAGTTESANCSAMCID